MLRIKDLCKFDKSQMLEDWARASPKLQPRALWAVYTLLVLFLVLQGHFTTKFANFSLLWLWGTLSGTCISAKFIKAFFGKINMTIQFGTRKHLSTNDLSLNNNETYF